jgi:hypothetical protein
VTELENLLSSRQAVVSQQLARLRLEGLVSARREGQAIFYSILDPKVRDMIELLARLYCNRDRPRLNGQARLRTKGECWRRFRSAHLRPCRACRRLVLGLAARLGDFCTLGALEPPPMGGTRRASAVGRRAGVAILGTHSGQWPG